MDGHPQCFREEMTSPLIPGNGKDLWWKDGERKKVLDKYLVFFFLISVVPDYYFVT